MEWFACFSMGKNCTGWFELSQVLNGTSGSEDKSIKEWDLATAKCANTVNQHTSGGIDKQLPNNNLQFVLFI